MKYLHAMVRVRDLDASLKFFRDGLGLLETRRHDHPAGRFIIDEDILRERGVSDFDAYAVDPTQRLLPDLFLDEALPK